MGTEPNREEKQAIYDRVAGEISAVIEGETSSIARMATVSNILHYTFDHFFWTGFYQVDPLKEDELVVGPYQGTMGCLRIPFGRGVCGTAAASGDIQIIDDVHAFPGHIACDPNSRSEIVVPVHDANGKLIAVFDVDSDQPAMFDDCDGRNLAAIVQSAFGAVR